MVALLSYLSQLTLGAQKFCQLCSVGMLPSSLPGVLAWCHRYGFHSPILRKAQPPSQLCLSFSEHGVICPLQIPVHVSAIAKRTEHLGDKLGTHISWGIVSSASLLHCKPAKRPMQCWCSGERGDCVPAALHWQGCE